MRISDWSSDVCSPDLAAGEPELGGKRVEGLVRIDDDLLRAAIAYLDREAVARAQRGLRHELVGSNGGDGAAMKPERAKHACSPLDRGYRNRESEERRVGQ